MRNLGMFVMAIMLLFGLSGCSKNNAYKSWSTAPYIQDTYNESVVELANQLLKSTRIKNTDKVAITSFVDLHQLNKTTHFGRNLSESMYNELHTRGFYVVDVRGTDTVRINADGEFFITRDITLLDKKIIESAYILIATYSKFGKGVLLNARIIDNKSGDVISTARTIIDVDSCDVYENCNGKQNVVVATSNSNNKVDSVILEKRTIGLSDAGCSYVECPQNCLSEGCYKDVVKSSKKNIQKQIPEVPEEPKVIEKNPHCDSTIIQTLYK